MTLLALSTLPTLALERTFLTTILRGNMTITEYPAILINKTTLRFSPGSWIWGTYRLMWIPVSLGNSRSLVNYTQNTQGDVDRVWILTPDEANQPVESQRSNLKW